MAHRESEAASRVRGRARFSLKTFLLWLPTAAIVLALLIKASAFGGLELLVAVCFIVIGLPFIYFAEIIDWLLGVNRKSDKNDS